MFRKQTIAAIAAAAVVVATASGVSAASLGGLTSATITVGQYPGPAPAAACIGATSWDPTAIYTEGDTVIYAGELWLSQWWNKDTTPGPTNGPWEQQTSCAPGGGSTGTTNPDQPACSSNPWYDTTIYTEGDTVVYGGDAWQAEWWTRGQTPGEPNGPWQNLYACNSS